MTSPRHAQVGERFAVVTDSTCDLGHLELSRLGVTCLPLTVHLEGQQFLDWTELDPEALYGRMRDGHQATTSPPSVEAFAAVYRPLLATGQKVLSIHLSSTISETVRHAREAVELLGAQEQVTVLDSGLASAGLAEYLLAAVRVRDQGGTLEDALAETTIVGETLFSEFVVPNLEFLRRGGRLSRAGLLLGNLTGLRPVLGFEQGQIVPRRRVRAQQAEENLIERLEQHAQGRPVALTVYLAGRDQARLQELQSAIRHSRLKVVRGRLQLIGCVVGAHVGPDTYGFVSVPVPPAIAASV